MNVDCMQPDTVSCLRHLPDTLLIGARKFLFFQSPTVWTPCRSVRRLFTTWQGDKCFVYAVWTDHSNFNKPLAIVMRAFSPGKLPLQKGQWSLFFEHQDGAPSFKSVIKIAKCKVVIFRFFLNYICLLFVYSGPCHCNGRDYYWQC